MSSAAASYFFFQALFIPAGAADSYTSILFSA